MPRKPRRPMWELKQKAETPETLDVYIYGDVEGDEYDWWTDEVIESETSANHFREVLGEHQDAKQINIYINSNGGSVFEGTAIYNQLKRHPAHKTVYVDGFACSIASVIAMVGDEVVMPKNALMMIHNMWTVAIGNASELRKAADDLDIINQAGREAYLQKAGDKLTPEALAKMEDDETWLTAEECIQYGLADRFADQDADMSKSGEVLQKANLTLQQRIQINKSLVAQLRDITQLPEEKARDEPKQEQKSEQEPETQKTATVMERLAAMTRKDG